MPDYGHDLAFGTFITPQSRNPDEVVFLAQVTEPAGLDLATFQDHPYQPAFLDTWTLLSWVAARTKTVKVSANVLNLPLRPPAVLARAAAGRRPRPARDQAPAEHPGRRRHGRAAAAARARSRCEHPHPHGR